MTRFVLDASVALAWIFEDEYSPYAEYVAEVIRNGLAMVPVVWPLEITNAVLTAVRRGRLRPTDGPMLLGALDRLQIEIDRGIALESLSQVTFAVGMAHELSAYDATYLELAVRRGLPLATQDTRLTRAATRSGVEILRS
jgi:predicted nucleic acid-binding protein